MIVRRASVLVVAALATLVAFAAPAAAGESKSDKAILKAGVITKADVPSDWTSKKASSSDQQLRAPECREIKTAVDKAKKNTPRRRSRDFEPSGSGSATSAQDTVYAFKNVSGATSFFANYSDSTANACFEALADELASGEPTAGSPAVAPITDLQGVGDEAVGYEITIPYAAGGESTTLYVDFVVVRQGRVVLGFGFSNRDVRIPEGPPIVRAVVGRVADVEASA
jgi:hypothetical protein